MSDNMFLIYARRADKSEKARQVGEIKHFLLLEVVVLNIIKSVSLDLSLSYSFLRRKAPAEALLGPGTTPSCELNL
jgi:hypothetical protein